MNKTEGPFSPVIQAAETHIRQRGFVIAGCAGIGLLSVVAKGENDVPVPLLVDLFAEARGYFRLYEGRGWTDDYVLTRVPEWAVSAFKLAEAIVKINSHGGRMSG